MTCIHRLSSELWLMLATETGYERCTILLVPPSSRTPLFFQKCLLGSTPRTTYYMLVQLWRHGTNPPVFTSQPTTHQTTCQEEESSNPNPSHTTSPPVFTSQPKSPPTTKPPAKRKKAATPTPDPTSFSTGIWVRKLNYKAIGGASLLKTTPTKQCVCT